MGRDGPLERIGVGISGSTGYESWFAQDRFWGNSVVSLLVKEASHSAACYKTVWSQKTDEARDKGSGIAKHLFVKLWFRRVAVHRFALCFFPFSDACSRLKIRFNTLCIQATSS